MARIEALSWDEAAEEHIGRHGIRFNEVEEAAYNVQYARSSRGYLLILGQTNAGKYLTVILDDEGDGVWYPVTARPMNPSERRLLRRRGTRRGRR